MKERPESLHLFPSDECLQQMRSCRHRVEKCLGPHILHRDSDKLKAMYSSKKSSDIYNTIQVRKCSRNGRLLTRKFRSSKNRGKRKKKIKPLGCSNNFRPWFRRRRRRLMTNIDVDPFTQITLQMMDMTSMMLTDDYIHFSTCK